MKKKFIVLALLISTILVAQNAVWENPKPFVLGDNIELQQALTKTTDGNTIFFWSKTELEGRIMYATKLNEQGEYQWTDENKIVLEHTPAVWLEEITEISGNNYVLHFSHVDYKNGPVDNIYNIMDENGDMIWNESFSFLDYNDNFSPITLFKDIETGFNILCRNHDNTESKILNFDLNGNFIEIDVSGYSYTFKQIVESFELNEYYHIFYFENGNLVLTKLNDSFEPVNSTNIPLNITTYSFDKFYLYLLDNNFYFIDGYNEFACKISENGDLIWLTNWNIDEALSRFHNGMTEDGDMYILDSNNDQIHLIVINNNGEIETELPILQRDNLSDYLYASYNDNNKLNVIATYNDDNTYYLAQTVDLDGSMTYPLEGLQLDVTSKYYYPVLTSYPDKFSFLFLHTGDDRKTYLEINTYNNNGVQIIPEDQTILESSFVSLSSMVYSRYLPNGNCVLFAFIAHRGLSEEEEIYIQKINQVGELLYEEEGQFITAYESQENIEEVLINDEGFVFVIYEDFDNNINNYKCDVFNQYGEFVRNFTLGSGNFGYDTYHHYTDDGIIFCWALHYTCYKVHKFNQNEFLWDDPLTIPVPTTNGMGCHITDNYIMYKYYDSPNYAKFLRQFDDEGNFYPDWIYNLNNIENLSWISRAQQANDNFYFIGQIMQDEYKLLGIDSNQQILFNDLNITMPYSGFGVNFLIDENIYLTYQDTIQQCVKVDKFDMSGQNIWSNDVLAWDPSYYYGIDLHKSSTNSISMITSHTENFRFASMDLYGNLVTPLPGEIIADSRGEKRIINTHEMANGQFLITWYDYCVGNILDDDGVCYNAICGQLYDFSALSTDEYTMPSSHSYQLSNFPNPFNPETIISFSIPYESKIKLSIFNIKGQKVKQLVSNQLPSGEHSIIWNGDNDYNNPVGSGIYYYKLNVNGKAEAVKKCLLLK
ncbi:MAG: FlgD immunoglobulin-like domain containing protein [Candidatus Tenebribacter burtonii]|nr:FlgD immunoglobulin-like domain containing protein [Candidatus Tenebribacter burtonii]